jgi:hypothetical protein
MLCRVQGALGKDSFPLGKAFGVHGKFSTDTGLFAECFLPGTRQRKVAVTAAVPFTVTLPSAPPALGKDFFLFFFKSLLSVLPA